MLVKALVRAVEDNADAAKPMSIVTLETTNPIEIIQVRLFKNSIADGTVAAFKQVIGAEMDVPLQPEIYNGKLSWNMPFGQRLKLPARAAAVVTDPARVGTGAKQ